MDGYEGIEILLDQGTHLFQIVKGAVDVLGFSEELPA